MERTGRPLVDSLGRSLAKRQHLLILDNFEQLLPAAPLVTALLAAAAELSVLATSREVLSLHGEHVYLVPPLTVPDPAHGGSLAELSGVESVQLFVQRARAASANFQLTEENAPAIAAICTRLDGLPLAIELAAARTKLFGTQQLLERLESALGLLTGGARDAPDRQRTLRAAIDWSYDLLEEDEQILFARLAVFTGGRSLEAVEAICGPGLGINVLDGLESLLNKSLLYQEEGPVGEPRFMMLQTIQEYAQERLSASGEERQLRDSHLEYFLSLAEEMEPGFRRHGQLQLLARTESEWDNIRAAFNWGLESKKFEAAARLISALDYFLFYGDRIAEGFHMIARLFANMEAIPRTHRARFLLGAGRSAENNGEIERGKLFYRQALALAQEVGDRHIEAWSLVELSRPSHHPEDNEIDVRRCKEGLALMQKLGDRPGEAMAHNGLGELARVVGDYETARKEYDTCVAICRETGEGLRSDIIKFNLAYIAYREGDYQRARDLALSYIRQRYDFVLGENVAGSGLALLAGPLARLGEPEKAAKLFSAAQHLLRVGHQPSDAPEYVLYIADLQAQLDEATLAAAWAEGRAMTLEQAVAYALED
jgi:predicted ATPase